MMNNFKYCPMCASTKIECKNNRKWICPDCGYDLYHNVAAAVGIVIMDNEKNVLFEVRAKNPKKGYITLPGGFIDFDESAESAIKRECREEIGFVIEDFEYICTFPNTYEYKNVEYKTCDIFYKAKLPGKYKSIQNFIKSLKKEESEVVDFVYYKIETKEDVEKLPIAFESTKNTLLKITLSEK